MKTNNNFEFFNTGENEFIVNTMDNIVLVTTEIYGKPYIKSFPRYNDNQKDCTKYAIVIACSICEANAYSEFIDKCIDEGRTEEANDAIISYNVIVNILEEYLQKFNSIGSSIERSVMRIYNDIDELDKAVDKMVDMRESLPLIINDLALSNVIFNICDLLNNMCDDLD